ncbi:hypothetical protein C8T65DRAFT_688319, partial [Cerioporus squamosus]
MDNPRSGWLLPSLVLVVADPPYHITCPSFSATRGALRIHGDTASDLFVLVTAPGVPQSLLCFVRAGRHLDDGCLGQHQERRWGSYAPVTGSPRRSEYAVP